MAIVVSKFTPKSGSSGSFKETIITL
jgi:hypothetical protein